MSAAKVDELGLTPEEHDAVRHWQEYGQRGTTPARRIMPWDWNNLKPFRTPKTASWTTDLKPHQVPVLLQGFMPTNSDNSTMGNALFSGALQIGDTFSIHGMMSNALTPQYHASEDKWFVYADGPTPAGQINIHMHRSWTGEKAVQLHIEAGDYNSPTKQARITTITWESDSDTGPENDVIRAKTVARTVCDWILNVELEGAISKEAKRDPAELSNLMRTALLKLPTTGPQLSMRSGVSRGIERSVLD
jgi:hypothetical protein